MTKFVAILLIGSLAFANEIPLSVIGNGATKSTGASVQLSATIGQTPIGISGSANYVHGSGFWYGTGSAFSGFENSNTPELPLSFTLHPVYPNPFNPLAHISFSVPHASHAKLSVFDIHGRLAETLVDQPYPAGHHTISWNATALSSGAYFVRLSTPEFESIQKAVLLK